MKLRKAAIVLMALTTLCSVYFAYRIHLGYRDSSARVAALLEPGQDRVALRAAIAVEDQEKLGFMVFGAAVAYGALFLFLTRKGSDSVPVLLFAATPIMALILALCHALTTLAVLGLVAAFSGFTAAGVLLYAHERRMLA